MGYLRRTHAKKLRLPLAASGERLVAHDWPAVRVAGMSYTHSAIRNARGSAWPWPRARPRAARLTLATPLGPLPHALACGAPFGRHVTGRRGFVSGYESSKWKTFPSFQGEEK